VDEKIPRLARGMHLSVVYPVYRASGAYRLNNTGAIRREWGARVAKERRGGEIRRTSSVRRSTAIRPGVDTPMRYAAK